VAVPSINSSEAREIALTLVEQARGAALDSPRRLAVLAEAQVFATLSLAPDAAPEPALVPASKPARSRSPKAPAAKAGGE
jgi:hypothetical protein